MNMDRTGEPGKMMSNFVKDIGASSYLTGSLPATIGRKFIAGGESVSTG
jgi:hypothetical protein